MIDAWWLALPTAVAGVLLAVLWSVRRHTSPSLAFAGDLTSDSELPIDRLMPSLAGLAPGHCAKGNAVTVLENGAFFDVLIERIGEARHSVHFETFLWKDGTLGRRLAHAFAERARAGVAVRVLLDATGCRRINDETVRIMESAECRVARFHPLAFKHLGMLNDRDHRKLVVIDGREAFVGGHCIVDH